MISEVLRHYASAWGLVTLALAVLIGILFRRRYSPGLSDVPGPFIASVSTLWQIFHVCDGHIEQAVLKQHQRHGHFVRIGHKEVSCSHPDSISTILAAPIHKGAWYRTFAVPDQKHQTPMSETDPKRHQERSTIVNIGYMYSNLVKSEPIIDRCMSILKKRLGELADKSAPVEMDKWLNYLNFDCIGELTYSQHFGFLEKGADIGGAIANMRFLMFYTALIGYMLWLHPILLGSPLIGWLNLKPSRHIFATVQAAVNARKERADEAKGDMMELWLANHKRNPGRMADHEINAVASSTTIAGSETMTGAMEAVFYFLLRHPAHLRTLQAELDAAHVAGGLSTIVSYAEVQKLPFLQACVKETIRYFPPTPFNLPRVAPAEGLTIGGRHFPGGTVLSVNPLCIHHSVEIWGPDAASFNPYRWLQPLATKPQTYALDNTMDKFIATFGAGYNGCPGKLFAYAQIGKLTATLLRDFEFEQVDKDQEWHFRTQFTVVQENWPCRIRRRLVRTTPATTEA